jgi:hypothetical protein
MRDGKVKPEPEDLPDSINNIQLSGERPRCKMVFILYFIAVFGIFTKHIFSTKTVTKKFFKN